MSEKRHQGQRVTTRDTNVDVDISLLFIAVAQAVLVLFQDIFSLLSICVDNRLSGESVFHFLDIIRTDKKVTTWTTHKQQPLESPSAVYLWSRKDDVRNPTILLM